MFTPIETPRKQDKAICLGLILFSIIIHAAGLFQFTALALRLGLLPASINWTVAVAVNSLLILIEIILLFICQTRYFPKIWRFIQWVVLLFSHLRWLNLLFSLALLVAFTYLVLSPFGHYIPIPFTRLFLFWLIVLSISLMMKAWSLRALPRVNLEWFQWLGIAWLVSAFGYIAFSYYPDISRYPYTLAWSETSRYYYASLFFSEKIYGLQTPPTVLHPSRYLLQAIPFLLPDSTLVMHRAWQVFLWLSITTLTAFFVSKRSGFTRNFTLLGTMTLLWAFIYLLVGPVYYHLQIPLILILWGFNHSKSSSPFIRFLLNIAILSAASAWAGISRVNWFPVPGLLAASLIFLEQPISGKSQHQKNPQGNNTKILTWSSFQYGIQTVAWTLFGTAVAFATQNLYIRWSGNTLKEFTSSFSSDLLWYRLWPSSTYPLGILPGAILVSLPLLILITGKLIENEDGTPYWKRIHPIRLLGLAVILLVLFAGGLVVSVKIGGGSNLHNMDAFMSLLLVITLMITFNQMITDQPKPAISARKNDGVETITAIKTDTNQLTSVFKGRMQNIGLVLSLVIPIVLVIIARGPQNQYPTLEEINRGFIATNRAIETLKPDHKNVLFLTNRHWLTFGYITDIPLIPDYERVFLMEMAMSNNEEYLERFRKDLEKQRFDLIVSEPIFRINKSQEARFAEENNAWVKNVSKYILCYYAPSKLIRPVSMQIFIPRQNPEVCE